MDAAWNRDVRAVVIERVLAAMTEACGLDTPSSAWWVTFRVIDNDSCGARGGVLAIEDILEDKVFTNERVAAIRSIQQNQS